MRTTAAQYARAWHDLLTTNPAAEWDNVSSRMLALIQQHGGMRFLPDILRLVEERDLAQRGITRVTVRTAHTLPEQLVTEQVKSVIPEGALQIDMEHDASMIGGIQIETANQRWDISLRGQLRKLAQLINTN